MALEGPARGGSGTDGSERQACTRLCSFRHSPAQELQSQEIVQDRDDGDQCGRGRQREQQPFRTPPIDPHRRGQQRHREHREVSTQSEQRGAGVDADRAADRVTERLLGALPDRVGEPARCERQDLEQHEQGRNEPDDCERPHDWQQKVRFARAQRAGRDRDGGCHDRCYEPGCGQSLDQQHHRHRADEADQDGAG